VSIIRRVKKHVILLGKLLDKVSEVFGTFVLSKDDTN
jgi:hypothetical protein